VRGPEKKGRGETLGHKQWNVGEQKKMGRPRGVSRSGWGLGTRPPQPYEREVKGEKRLGERDSTSTGTVRHPKGKKRQKKKRPAGPRKSKDRKAILPEKRRSKQKITTTTEDCLGGAARTRTSVEWNQQARFLNERKKVNKKAMSSDLVS